LYFPILHRSTATYNKSFETWYAGSISQMYAINIFSQKNLLDDFIAQKKRDQGSLIILSAMEDHY
jgi:hypothetical protein